MKNSNEWLDDIERKLNERYDRRNRMRKKVVQCIGGLASCSLILLAVLTLPKNIMTTPDEDIMTENSTSTTVSKNEPPTSYYQTGHNDNSSETDITTEHQDTSISVTNKTTAKSEPNSTTEVTIIESTENISTIQTQTDEIVQLTTEPPEITEPPTQPTVEPTTSSENYIHINKINSTSPVTVTSNNCQVSEDIIWSYQQMTEYYGIDFSGLINDYEADICDEYTVKIYNDGTMKSDLYEIEYHAPDEKYIRISASKVTYPYDCIYISENKETSMIQDISVVIGGMSKNGGDINDFFYADFQKNEVNYRFIGENLSESEFCNILSNFIES